MNEYQSQRVQNFLVSKTQQGKTPQSQKLIFDHKFVFDPTTGELVVPKSSETLPNCDVVLEPYKIIGKAIIKKAIVAFLSHM